MTHQHISSAFDTDLEAVQAQREPTQEAEQRIKEHSLSSRVGRVLRRIAPWAFRGR